MKYSDSYNLSNLLIYNFFIKIQLNKLAFVCNKIIFIYKFFIHKKQHS